MYIPLIPCPACGRHVRRHEGACPFCAAALPANLAKRAVPSATRRLSRGAAFFFATSITALGIAGAGCSDDGDAQEVDDTGSLGLEYGGPPDTHYYEDSPIDTGAARPDDGADADEVDDTGSTQVDYGLPGDTGADGATADGGADTAADGTTPDGGDGG